MEAVAFRIYSLPEVAATAATAWTCLAAVLAAAAAAGLWRLRSSTVHADFTLAATKPLELDTSTSLISSTEAESSAEMPPERTTSSASPAPSPKERYTAYYHDSGRVGCCVVESDDEEEDRDHEDDDGVHDGAWEETDPFEWEVVRPLVATAATDETGRRRSPSALTGSVVRLWDQGAEWGLTAAGPRRRGSGGTVSSF